MCTSSIRVSYSIYKKYMERNCSHHSELFPLPHPVYGRCVAYCRVGCESLVCVCRQCLPNRVESIPVRTLSTPSIFNRSIKTLNLVYQLLSANLYRPFCVVSTFVPCNAPYVSHLCQETLMDAFVEEIRIVVAVLLSRTCNLSLVIVTA